MQPRHYRRQRRDALIPPVVLDHPRVVVLLVLVGVLAIVLTLKAVATGSPETPTAVAATSAAATQTQPPPAAPEPSPAPTTVRPSPDDPFPAVPVTPSPPPPIVPMTYSYEAEDPATARSPDTEVYPFTAASGGQLVGRIGDTRFLRFPGVLADTGGEYTMVIYYATPDPRTATVKVNDDAGTQVAFAALPRDQVGAVTLKIVLLVGVNSVEIDSPHGQWGPDLDRITVR
jgi:hypothetical protein